MIVAKCRQDIEHIDIESVVIEIVVDSKHLFVMCCYRPQWSSVVQAQEFISNFQTQLNCIYKQKTDAILILGGFNDRCFEWNDDHPNSEYKLKLKNLLSQNNLHQIINQPTHITPTSVRFFYLIITINPGFVVNSGIDEPIGESIVTSCKHKCQVLNQHFLSKSQLPPHENLPLIPKISKLPLYVLISFTVF